MFHRSVARPARLSCVKLGTLHTRPRPTITRPDPILNSFRSGHTLGKIAIRVVRADQPSAPQSPPAGPTSWEGGRDIERVEDAREGIGTSDVPGHDDV
jgi:hypothetical protein